MRLVRHALLGLAALTLLTGVGCIGSRFGNTQNVADAVGRSLEAIPDGPYGRDPDSLVSIDVERLSFGAVVVRSTARREIRVVNHQSFPVTMVALSATEGRFTHEAVPLPLTLQPGASRTVSVYFTPVGLDEVEGLLRLEFDTAGARFLEVRLSGSGQRR